MPGFGGPSDGKHLLPGTFDIEQTPQAVPSFEQQQQLAVPLTEGGSLEDASVVPWQDRNTCCNISTRRLEELRQVSHEIAEQNLRVQRPTWVSKLDVCHSIYSSFLEDREPCPIVINIWLENLDWRLRG